jgi:hypothetical protein
MLESTDETTSASSRWTLQDERRLARFCAASMTIGQLAIRLDRTELEIIEKLRQLQLSAGRYRHGPPERQLVRRPQRRG